MTHFNRYTPLGHSLDSMPRIPIFHLPSPAIVGMPKFPHFCIDYAPRAGPDQADGTHKAGGLFEVPGFYVTPGRGEVGVAILSRLRDWLQIWQEWTASCIGYLSRLSVSRMYLLQSFCQPSKLMKPAGLFVLGRLISGIREGFCKPCTWNQVCYSKFQPVHCCGCRRRACMVHSFHAQS